MQLRVLASTTSPPFIVMSYRRACVFCQKLRGSADAAAANNNTSRNIGCECEGEFNTKRSLSTYSSLSK